MRRVLITGGAGFIGSHLADILLEGGYAVRVFDSLVPQVHDGGARPDYLADDVELVVGDVRNAAAVAETLRGVDAVVHLAAAVGVGQSMYEIAHYVGVNDLGTAVLLEALTRSPVQALVVASSMSIYGEGLGLTADDHPVEPDERSPQRLRDAMWEPTDAAGEPLRPAHTPETKRPALSSIYALNKFVQERACLLFGRAYDTPTVALRLFNVFGPRQALSNPYTGVMAIFAARILNGRRPMVFEDGRQRRDFVHVRDVARACKLALERPEAAGRVINVGSGQNRTIASVGRDLARVMGRPELEPEITGRYRIGDIRHCFADTSLAREALTFAPEEDFERGLAELALWLERQVAVDHVEKATQELLSRGLVA